MFIYNREISKIISTYRIESLYKNSSLIILSKMVVAASGFIFWIFAARLYPIEDIGLASALLSLIGLISLFSDLGLTTSLIRFFPVFEKRAIFNTCLIIVTIASLIIGVISLGIVILIYPASTMSSFIQNQYNDIYFLLFAIFNSVLCVCENTFFAMNKIKYYLYDSLILASRIPLLIPLAYLGSFGIFYSFIWAYILAILFIVLVLNSLIGISVNIPFLKASFKFSYQNYISNCLFTAPKLLMPLIILHLLGESEAGKYYIAYAIGSLILMIPEGLGISLFVEGCNSTNLKSNVMKTLIATYIILIPISIFCFIYSNTILEFFGKNYAESNALLRIFIISSFFVTIHTIFIPIQNIRMKTDSVIKVNLLRFIVLSVLSFFFIMKFGIIGAGYAWIITYILLDLGIILIVKRNGWIKSKFWTY